LCAVHILVGAAVINVGMTYADKLLRERCKLIDGIHSSDKPILSAASDSDTKVILFVEHKAAMIYCLCDGFWEF
jgi:hypothetical protein